MDIPLNCDPHLKVGQIMDKSDRNWDLDDLKQAVPAYVLNDIDVIPVPSFAYPQVSWSIRDIHQVMLQLK